MGRKPAAQRNPAPARQAPAKPGDDVTADYFAQSNTAIAGVHFAYGDPIVGVTDRDQIELALRLRAIGPNPPGAAKTAAEELIAGNPELLSATCHLALATNAAAVVDLALKMSEGAKEAASIAEQVSESASAVADALDAAFALAKAAAEAEGAEEPVKAAAVGLAERSAAARAVADDAVNAFEDAKDFAEETVAFLDVVKKAVAELGK